MTRPVSSSAKPSGSIYEYIVIIIIIITDAKEVMFSSLFVYLSVCLFVSNVVQKLPNGFAWNCQGRLAMVHYTNDSILVAIRVRNPDTDSYRDSGKTCLGRGMHCPSASSCHCHQFICLTSTTDIIIYQSNYSDQKYTKAHHAFKRYPWKSNDMQTYT